MPTYGEKQTPAGIDKSKAPRKPGRRVMKCKNRTIESTLVIDDIPYKGNAVLNANKS
jgi:hypothetical protein